MNLSHKRCNSPVGRWKLVASDTGLVAILWEHDDPQLGRPMASRAVGAANGRNPVSIIVPCHRVIGSSGKLTGFAGGLHAKAHLLKLEMGNLLL